MIDIVTKDMERIDKYLAEKLNLSRSKVQKLIDNGCVLVNSKSVSSSYKVRLDDKIEIREDDLDFSIDIVKENIPIDIVYEDDYLLIINKESGMVTHPAPGNYSGTLVNALLYRFDLKGDSIRPGIVHRLDKDTSGVMVVAKDEKTHDLLAKMIKNKEVKRHYVAIVDGVIKNDSGTIDAPIGRDINNRQKMAVTDINGKESITHFKVLERFNNNTLIECILDTGRTHQIRVHLSYIGYPVTNDPVYGRKKATKFGQMLHSKSIEFDHPITGKHIYYEVCPPLEFRKMLETLESEKVN